MESLKVFISSSALYKAQSVMAATWWDIANYSNISDLIRDVEKDLNDKGDLNPEIICLDTRNDYLELYREFGLNWIENYIDIQNNIHSDKLNSFKAYCSFKGFYDKYFLEIFDDKYIGKYDSEEDFAREYIKKYYSESNIPELFRNYFDYEAYARDLFFEGYYFYKNGFVFKF